MPNHLLSLLPGNFVILTHTYYFVVRFCIFILASFLVINWLRNVLMYLMKFLTEYYPFLLLLQMALQPGVGLGLRYNMPPVLSVPCSISPFNYTHLSPNVKSVILVCPGSLCLSRVFITFRGLLLGFVTIIFLQGEVVGLTHNPQPGGPGYSLLSGSSPSTCPARVALPVADATAGIALRIIWPRKPSHPALAFDKVEISWRGITHSYIQLF